MQVHKNWQATFYKNMEVTEFISIVTTAPTADNSQPWRFFCTGDQLNATYHSRSMSPSPFTSCSHGTIIASGALHHTMEAVTSKSVHCRLLPLDNKNTPWSLEIPLNVISSISHKIDFSDITGRHTNRHRFQPIPNDLLVNLEKCSSPNAIILRERSIIKELSDCLRLCSEARFNDKELHEWLFSSLRWTDQEAACGTGLDISTLNLPPGGRSLMHFLSPWIRMRFLNRFGFYKIMATADTQLFSVAPAIIAFCGKKKLSDVWDAGKQIQKTWIALNQQGIAVHPYYAITDIFTRLHQGKLTPRWEASIKKAEKKLTDILSLRSDEQLHMLLRIGMPTVTPTLSRRLPAQAFLE